MFYWFMKTIVAGPLLRTLFRPRLEGLENIPTTGPVILASNHLSFIDSVILPLMIKRRIYFLAASTYFQGGGLGKWAVKRFLLATGMIPIDRSGGKASEASLQAGMSVLTKGNVLGIYPEGGRSRDGKAHRGRTGVARLVFESGAPVVPVAMIDTDKVMPSERPRADPAHRHLVRSSAGLQRVRRQRPRPRDAAHHDRQDHGRGGRDERPGVRQRVRGRVAQEDAPRVVPAAGESRRILCPPSTPTSPWGGSCRPSRTAHAC
jgi:1-acyl-sn-glycerol-3-phosphate acyltransferase